MSDLPLAPPPARVSVPYGHHLRPVRLSDQALHLTAVEGSLPVLRDLHGPAHGWPPATWSAEHSRRELVRQVGEMERRTAWTYALLDADETALLGCVRVERGADGRPSAWWWIVAECRGTDLAAAVDALVPRWLDEAWSPASFR
jgi:hypothetical protein